MRNTKGRSESTLQNTKRWSLALLMGVSLLSTLPSLATAAVVPGFDGTVFPRNDDGSTGAVALGFTANYFGVPATTVFVNNNGNISLDAPFGNFTPFLLATTSPPRRLIAPFFGDVDTRNFGDPVAYGPGTFAGRPAFGVSWRNVAFFGASGAGGLRRNTFQLLLVERTDIAAGDFDIVFNYDQLQWEAGTASGSDANGLGGSAARSGYTIGTGDPGTFFEFPGGGVPGTFVDGGTAPLIAGTLNSGGVLGRYIFPVRNGVAIPPTGFDCSLLAEVVGEWELGSGGCGNFTSNALAARYESAMYGFAPAQVRGTAPGEYAYEVEFVANRPRQPSAAASIMVAGSPLPLRTATQNWDRAIAFNISHNRKFSIFSYNGPGLPVALQKWTTPADVVINQAPLANVLRVDRVVATIGYTLVFSINGVVVKQLPDTFGVDQFGTGFVRSIPTTNNLVMDDWMNVLRVTLTVPPTVRAEQAASGLVSRAQERANNAANSARGNDNPLFATNPENEKR